MEKRKASAFGGVLLGMFSSLIMQTILATVLPDVVKELGGAEFYGWTFSAYMISSTITIPIFAKLADIYGRKQFYLLGMGMYLTGSALIGGVNSMEQLLASRVLQGLGAGAVTPAAVAMISDLFPAEERGKMMGVLAVTQVLGNVTGPIIGGVITDYWGWRWAFYANLPVGLLAIGLVALGFTESKRPKTTSLWEIDLKGGLLLGLTAVLLIKGLEVFKEANANLWQAGGFVLAGILALILFGRQEKKHPDPVVSTGLITTPNVPPSLVNALLYGAVMYATVVILPPYGQLMLGDNALEGGKMLLPLTLGLGLGGLLCGKFSRTASYRRLTSGGWAFVLLGYSGLILGSMLSLSYLPLASVILLIGMGLGFIYPTLILSSQNAVGENERAVVGGLVQMSRNFGGAVGIPVFTGFIVSGAGTAGGLTGMSAYLTIFGLMMAVTGTGLAAGLRFKGAVCQESRA